MDEQRLIDANVFNRFDYSTFDGRLSEDARQGMDLVISLIDKSPTVDAVTVVRCRNCKYARKLRDNFYGWDYSCKRFNAHATRANDFCSNGERKDEDEDGEIH